MTDADTTSTPGSTDSSTAEESAPSVDDLGLARRLEGDVTAIGAVDAPVVMIEYADYRCPFCGIFARDTMPDLMTEYVDSGLLRYEWRDLPVFGDESVQAAVAARAAGAQGRFWQYHSAVFAAAPERGHLAIDRATLMEFAEQAKVPDLAAFERDLDDPVHRAAVQVDASQAQQIGATSTPIFMIGTTPVLGAQPLEAFRQVIDDEIALAAGH
ncbi:DsbA family protein [Cryobacterium sp. PH29-G1]|uniref:DsbA family protein n=1 Tax=Cryobacterium sp. PH29-G1 TaxID=3046211 RepID=UPI0024B8F257|nr:DsbA family protein [Cryobacterium sp. PH29-G1]MDJ0348362.1 DsbA family protein [Cryobacterium sp. PH29-G1]